MVAIFQNPFYELALLAAILEFGSLFGKLYYRLDL